MVYFQSNDKEGRLLSFLSTRPTVVRATHRGVQRGKAPLRFLSSPKSGGHRGLTHLFAAVPIHGLPLNVVLNTTAAATSELHERTPLRQQRYLSDYLYVAGQDRKTAAASSDASLLHDSDGDLAAGRASGNPRLVHH
jgi:hypothetical protein